MSLAQLLGRKSLTRMLREQEEGHQLHRVLGVVSLTNLAIGCIIGTGIFVLIGKVAREQAGPALVLSFVAAGTACVFAALCYAEFASMAPVAGSAYTYAYATLGELVAWIIGWDLVLEYAVSAAAVANGWSKYFMDLVHVAEEFLGFTIPEFVSTKLTKAPLALEEGEVVLSGQWFDGPALMIAGILTVILVLGIKESAFSNSLMVYIKTSVVLFVIFVGMWYVNTSNWKPFAPYGYGGIGFFGSSFVEPPPREAHPPRNLDPGLLARLQEQEVESQNAAKKNDGGAIQATDPNAVAAETTKPETTGSGAPVGMLAGAAIIFFSYVGFDSVSTHAEEAKNPNRDVPIAILASLFICTALYIAMAAVITGMVPYEYLQTDAPVASAFAAHGLNRARVLISLGAVAGCTSVMLVSMLSQPRVLLAMSRDGLLPPSIFAAIHPKFKTPYISTMITGVLVAAMGSLLPLDILADLVSIGTLFAFVVVCAAVLILRYIEPERKRPFRLWGGPTIPILGMITCLILMFSLAVENWYRLFAWLAVGLVIYFSYGFWNSALRKERLEKGFVATE